MATNFPASLDSLTNPTSSDSLNSPSHSAQHANSNDAIEALQAKVGADGSAVATSLDYKVAQLEAISHGKILQVVATHKNDVFTSTSGSFADITGLSVTITPTLATSKILVLSNVSTFGSTSSGVRLRLMRDSTPISIGSSSDQVSDAGEYNLNSTNSVAMAYLDSPSTTSATVYKWQVSGVAGQTVGVNRDNNSLYFSASNIVVMEVSA